MDWLITVPGIATGVLSIAAPGISFVALRQSLDSRVQNAIANREFRGVMGLYIQIASAFVTTVSGLFLGIVYFLLFLASHTWFGLVNGVLALVAFGLLIWMFMLAGAARVSLDFYIPQKDFEPGDITVPPIASWLTWVRVSWTVIGFSVLVYRVSRHW